MKIIDQSYLVAETILDAFTTNLLQKMKREGSEKCVNIYEIVARSGLVDLSSLQKYFTSQIFSLASSNLTDKENTYTNLTEVFGKQHKWNYSKINTFTKMIITELLLPFTSSEVESLFKQILNLPNVNWKTFLMFISHFLLLYEDGPDILRTYNLNLIRDSLISSEVNKILIALILTRQAVNEGTHIHPSYGEWLKSTFHENSTCANNKKTFSSLMKVLSDLVPFEPACYLQAHILNPPFFPPNCRCDFNEYVVLAKTKLQDLKVFDDKIFKHGDPFAIKNEDVKEKMLEQATDDVVSMVKAFEANGKVPGRVIEMSIFRKPYYLSRFLPALMIPTQETDAKKKLVVTLHQSGKIPNHLYQKYISQCAELKAKDNTAVLACKDANAELMNLFEELPENLVKELTLKSNFPLGNHLQEIEKRLSILMQKDSNVEKELIYLDSTDSNEKIDSNIQQVANSLILSFTKCLCAVTNLEATHSRLDELLLLVAPFKMLQHALYHRLWEIIIKMGLTLQDHQIWLASALSVHLGSLQQFVHPVNVVGKHNSTTDENNFASLIIHCYPCNTDEQLKFLLMFCSNYMQYAFLYYTSFSVNRPTKKLEAYIPKVLIQKYSLVPQLYPDLQSCNCPSLIR
uniref:Uncharacterized protein n=1 Tax=Strigamia maritima TaxID=126957 RepID=T1JN88_STRMM